MNIEINHNETLAAYTHRISDAISNYLKSRQTATASFLLSQGFELVKSDELEAQYEIKNTVFFISVTVYKTRITIKTCGDCYTNLSFENHPQDVLEKLILEAVQIPVKELYTQHVK